MRGWDLSGPVVIVGARGGTNIAESLLRAAQDLGIEAQLCDVSISMSSNRWLNGVSWRLRDRRPPFARRLTQTLSLVLRTERPAAMISVGIAAVEHPTIEAWRAAGVPCLHFSTDDPWNPGLRSRWHLEALRAYDVVFSPRRRNLDDLAKLPCRRVVYLPFGYDPHLLAPVLGANPQVCSIQLAERPLLFVGGADEGRAAFFRRFIGAGGDVKLVGGYWDQWLDLKHKWLGHLSPPEVLALTLSAPVSLILVRQANRDGHTMRSFEAAAIGGCLLVEDTCEHRQIFGDDGQHVRYFSTAQQAAALHAELIRDVVQRERLASAVKDLVCNGRNTYRDRLETMIESVNAQDA